MNRLLAAEVGAGWVHLFDDTLTPQTLTSTLAAVRAAPPSAAPDLSDRSWEGAGTPIAGCTGSHSDDRRGRVTNGDLSRAGTRGRTSPRHP